MNFELIAAGFLALFLTIILVFLAYDKLSDRGKKMREIPAFSRLLYAIGLAVEDGTRLHISLGSSNMYSEKSSAALAGLSLLERVARTASISDRPSVTTSGDGALSILSQDTLTAAYRDIGVIEDHDPKQARMVGVTPFSYAAGTLSIIQDEAVSANILAGHFGSEIVLLTEAADRTEGFTLAGTDSLPGQAVLYAAAQQPLIGEELYAGGAYLNAGLVHTASLRAQDVVRWLLIGSIIVGGILKMLG